MNWGSFATDLARAFDAGQKEDGRGGNYMIWETLKRVVETALFGGLSFKTWLKPYPANALGCMGLSVHRDYDLPPRENGEAWYVVSWRDPAEAETAPAVTIAPTNRGQGIRQEPASGFGSERMQLTEAIVTLSSGEQFDAKVLSLAQEASGSVTSVGVEGVMEVRSYTILPETVVTRPAHDLTESSAQVDKEEHSN